MPRTRTSPSLSAIFTEAINQYTGRTFHENAVQVVRDPKVRGTYAIRVVNFYPDEQQPGDFLAILGDADLSVDAIDEALEEVEYEKWPPVSGNLQFFV